MAFHAFSIPDRVPNTMPAKVSIEHTFHSPCLPYLPYLSEFAVDDTNNQQNQHSDNSNGDYPIGSHPQISQY